MPSAKIGLPEVKLGILPGAGGTQRLPRLVGVEAALKMIVEGAPIGAADALKLGAIDELIDGDLKAGAIAFAERMLADRRPIRRTGSLPVTLDNPAIFDEFAKNTAKRQRGFLAPLECIKSVRFATEYPFEEGLKREHALCVELLASPQSKAQRHMFAAEREVAKVKGLPDDTPVRPINKAAVVGPGTMGAGIAICFANAGIPVALLGRSQASLDKAMKNIGKIYAGSVSRGSLAQAEMDKRLALITPTLSYDDLKDVDIVVEAVAEDMAVKKAVFAELDHLCKPGAVLATNTSYLDIDALAATHTSRPADVVGSHFLVPANVMRLLENVRPAKTAPDVLATIMKLGKTLGKLPVLVGTGDGFVLNRMLTAALAPGLLPVGGRGDPLADRQGSDRIWFPDGAVRSVRSCRAGCPTGRILQIADRPAGPRARAKLQNPR